MKKGLLGKHYNDSVTGFAGVATAWSEYMNGCVRVCLERLDSRGEVQSEWFDEQRLMVSKAKAGGPGAVAPDRNPPSDI